MSHLRTPGRLAAAALATLALAAAEARAELIYGVTDNSGTALGNGILLRIDSATGAAEAVGPVIDQATGRNVQAIEDAVFIGNDTLLATAYPGSGVAGAYQLYRIDTRTAQATSVGLITDGTSQYWVEGLAWANGVLYGSAAAVTFDPATGRYVSDGYGFDTSSHLIRIDPTTGAATDLGRFGPTGLNVEDLAYSPIYGLVGVDIGTLDPDPNLPNGPFSEFHTTPSLLFIDPNGSDPTNLVTRSVPLPPSSVVLVPNPLNNILSPFGPFVTGLDFGPDGRLYGSTFPTHFGGTSDLVTIDLDTGALSVVGTIAGPGLAGLRNVDGITFTVIPEPASCTLTALGLGLLTLGGLRRRARASAPAA